MPATGNIHPPLDRGPPIKPWRSLAGAIPKSFLMPEICFRYFSIPNYLLNNFFNILMLHFNVIEYRSYHLRYSPKMMLVWQTAALHLVYSMRSNYHPDHCSNFDPPILYINIKLKLTMNKKLTPLYNCQFNVYNLF